MIKLLISNYFDLPSLGLKKDCNFMMKKKQLNTIKSLATLHSRVKQGYFRLNLSKNLTTDH